MEGIIEENIELCPFGQEVYINNIKTYEFLKRGCVVKERNLCLKCCSPLAITRRHPVLMTFHTNAHDICATDSSLPNLKHTSMEFASDVI